MKKAMIPLFFLVLFCSAVLPSVYGEAVDCSIHAQLFADCIYQLCDQAEPGSWQLLPLFRHGKSVERAVIRKDGRILIQINQSSFEPDALVTDYSIMIDQALDNAREEMTRLTGYAAQAVMKASSQPYAKAYTQDMIEKHPNRIVLAGVSEARVLGRDFLIKKYEYTGSFPENAVFLKEQSVINYDPCLYDDLQENRLFLDDLLNAAFPGDSFDDTEKYCTNGIVDGVRHMGELHGDSYFISNDSDEIRIYAWHKQNENTDEKLVTAFEFFSGSVEGKELLEKYLSIFARLPGVPESLLPLLPYIHGDEFSWTSYLEIPAIQYGHWEMNFILSDSQNQPIAWCRYIP